jgi:N-acetylglucosamine-6-sulfatase
MRKLTCSLILALTATMLTGASATAPDVRPNIVFILVDDAASATLREMPRTRTLIVDRGATLAQFVYNQALCCPSRATMLRGQYSQNTGVTSNEGPDGGYGAFYRKGNEASTLGTWFDDAGYTTGYVGKYLNGYPGTADVPTTHVPPGWDHWFATSGSMDGFDYTVNDDGVRRSYGTAPTDYVTDVLARESKKIIERATGPLLLIVAPNAPHTPWIPAPRHAGMFTDERYPRKPSFNEADVSDKPAPIAARRRLTASDISEVDAAYGRRLASMQAVDEMIQVIADALQARKMLANTYLVFTSDNGYLQGEHRVAKGKDLPYEEAIRVPLYIRGPGIPAGSTVGMQVGNVDVPITLADAAGITPPGFVDGRSFLPLVQGSSIPWRQTYLLGAGGSDGFAGIRTDRYTYVEYFSGEGEFYDRGVDPYQLVNNYPSMNAALKSALHDRLLVLKKCSGSTCRSIEAQPVP